MASDRVGNAKYILKNKIGQGSFGYIFMGQSAEG